MMCLHQTIALKDRNEIRKKSVYWPPEPKNSLVHLCVSPLMCKPKVIESETWARCRLKEVQSFWFKSESPKYPFTLKIFIFWNFPEICSNDFFKLVLITYYVNKIKGAMLIRRVAKKKLITFSKSMCLSNGIKCIPI